MKVSIVGAGIMGLSTAWALSSRGHDVTVIDQGDIPNPLGSSHDQHRLIRYAYGDSKGYVRMVAEGYGAWEALWRDLGRRHYVETGTLCLGSDGEGMDWMRRSAETLGAMGHQAKMLDCARLALRFPLIDPRDVKGALYLSTGGVLFAEQILESMAEYLREQEVHLRPRTHVVEADLDRARLRLEDGEIVQSDVVIVAGGAWVSRLVPGMAQRVTPSRQVAAYMHPPEELDELWQRSPMILDLDASSGFYAVPPVCGRGLKIGDHTFTLEGDPDDVRRASEADVATVAERCAKRLTGWAGYRLERLQVCFYTVEPKERFIVEPQGLAGWVVSACSGHGFKFGPVIGRHLADAVEGRAGNVAAWAAGDA